MCARGFGGERIAPHKDTNPMTNHEPIYNGLRDLALKSSPLDLNLKLDDDKTIAFGIVMDTGYPNGTATLTSFVSGDASLYFSNGGGLLGGIGHETVRGAAQQFVKSAQTFLDKVGKTAEFPLPSNGKVRFFILTNHGVYGSSEL